MNVVIGRSEPIREHVNHFQISIDFRVGNADERGRGVGSHHRTHNLQPHLLIVIVTIVQVIHLDGFEITFNRGPKYENLVPHVQRVDIERLHAILKKR
jgi:hypothetical protein